MTLSLRALPLVILALLLVCTQAIAQPAQNRRIRGTIESLDGNTLMVKARDGASMKISLADNWQVTAYTKAQISDIKVGTCRALGWPAETPADLARAWQRILGRVSSYRDLDPALLGRVEELIVFVTD